MTKYVAVINEKGGCGKTTISTHLCVALMYLGYTVLFVDSDPQGSASVWKDTGMKNKRVMLPQMVDIPRASVGVEVRELSMCKHYDFVIIDGSPGLGADQANVSLIKNCDLVLIPVQPSPLDLWGSQSLVEMIKTRQELTDGVPEARFVISRSKKGGLLSGEIGEILENLGLGVLPQRTLEREPYKQVMAQGGTIFDVATQKDQMESFKNMGKNVAEILGVSEGVAA